MHFIEILIFAVMETKKDIQKKSLTRIKIIYNDDVAVLNYLADLQDRKIIKAIDDFSENMKKEKKDNFMLLTKNRIDDLVILILYNAPFGCNEDDNKFMLYAHTNCYELCRYFKTWLENEKTDDNKIHQAIDEIIRLLYFHYIQYEAVEKHPPDSQE